MSVVFDSQRSGDDGIIESQRDATPGILVVRGAVVASTIAYTVALKTAPTANVVIALAASGTTGHSVSPASLTFTSGNWATPQTVTVTITNSGSQTDLSVITHTLTSTDPDYNRLPVDEFAPLWTWRTYNPATERIAGSVAAIRAAAIDWVWGAALPSRLPDTVNTGVTISGSYYNQAGTANIARVDELVVNITNGVTTWVSKVYHFIPTSRRGRLVVVQQGHSSDLIQNGIGDTIKQFVETGYDVLALHMPGRGPNTPGGFIDHNLFQAEESPTFNPIKVFVEPITVALNHAIANNVYLQVSMVGISGGGWTTLFYSALDTRIARSYPIAGAMPVALRAAGDIGDYEQGTGTGPDEFYDTIASYINLYLLAADSNRQCYELHNLQDSCCFGEYSDQAYTSYVETEADGTYKFYRDRTVLGQHTISDTARDVIFSDLSVLASAEAAAGAIDGVGSDSVSSFLISVGVGSGVVGSAGVSV